MLPARMLVDYVKVWKAGTKFNLSYSQTLVTSPEENITLWIYYPKTVYDSQVTFTVKKK